MRDMDFYVKIHNKLEQEGIEVEKFDGRRIYAMFGEIPVEVSYELCSCHGGRLSISSSHCSFNYRIEHDSYEETGSNSPESELEYEIENEMVPIIKKLKTYVYCMELWREDKPDSHSYTYYNSVEALSRAVLEEDGYDIFTMEGTFTHYYPNPDMASFITFKEFENGRLHILRQDLKREKDKWIIEGGNWTNERIICKIFRKG